MHASIMCTSLIEHIIGFLFQSFCHAIWNCPRRSCLLLFQKRYLSAAWLFVCEDKPLGLARDLWHDGRAGAISIPSLSRMAEYESLLHTASKNTTRKIRSRTQTPPEDGYSTESELRHVKITHRSKHHPSTNDANSDGARLISPVSCNHLNWFYAIVHV